MPKPEKRSIVFKDALGGDTSEIVPNRPQGFTAADPIVPAASVEPAAVVPVEVERYDFRSMAEPARTVERVRAVLYDKRLSHGVRCAAAALALAFAGGDNVQLISIKKLLPDEKGYSGKLRNSALSALSEASLIRFEVEAGRGCILELLF